MAVYDQLRWFGLKPTTGKAQDSGKQVVIAAADTEILAANDNRTSFALVVRGAVNVFVKLGTAAPVAAPELKPNEVLACNDYTGAIHGIVAAGAGRVDVFEV